METALQSFVEAIAIDVRYWAEGRTDGECYDLNGWCARASAQLFKQLRAEGIASEIHSWTHPVTEEAHVYIVVDEHVVDVTASQFKQFRNTPVVIMHQREAQAYEFYQTVSVFHSVEDLRKWQKKSHWPPEQIAFI